MASVNSASLIVNGYAPHLLPYRSRPSSSNLALTHLILEVAGSDASAPLDPSQRALKERVCRAANRENLFPLRANCMATLGQIYLSGEERLEIHEEDKILLFKVFVGYVFCKRLPLSPEAIDFILTYSAALGIEETLMDCLHHEQTREVVASNPEKVKLALRAAIEHDQIGAVRVLLDYLSAQKINVPNFGESLSFAIGNKHPNAAVIILKHPYAKRIPRKGDHSIESALWKAALLDDGLTLRALLDNIHENQSASLHNFRLTLTLLSAIRKGKSQIVEIICTHPVAGKIILKKNYTLLHLIKIALKKADSKTAQALLKHPKAILIPPNGEGSLAELLFSAVKLKLPDFAKGILALPNARDINPTDPTQRGELAFSSVFVKAANLEDTLWLAAQQNDPESIYVILQHPGIGGLTLDTESGLCKAIFDASTRVFTRTVLGLYTHPKLAFRGPQTLENAFLETIQRGHVPPAIALCYHPEAKNFSPATLEKAKSLIEALCIKKVKTNTEWNHLYKMINSILSKQPQPVARKTRAATPKQRTPPRKPTWTERIEKIFIIGAVFKAVRSVAHAISASFHRLFSKIPFLKDWI